jgi:glutathione S-transferase
MMKLYEFAPTRSIRARWTLQELGVDFEAETVNLIKGEHRRPEFLALNPAGKLPVLVDGDLVLTESVAIVLYLAEKYPKQGLLPMDLAQRAEAYRWLLFAATELEQPLWRIARHTFLYAEAQRLPADVPIASREFIEMAAALDRHMRGRQFLVGERAASPTSSWPTPSTGGTRRSCSAGSPGLSSTWSACTTGRARHHASPLRWRASKSDYAAWRSPRGHRHSL